MKRARLLSVMGMLIGGIFGLISSTQTWFDVVIEGEFTEPIHVAGGSVIRIMVALSLAAIAAAITLSIVGRTLRYVIGVIGVAIGATLLVINIGLITSPSGASVAQEVTARTGLSGEESVAEMVSSMTPTPWVVLTVAAWVLILLSGVMVLISASRWPASGKKYKTAGPHEAAAGPLDSVDSWDDLSRGDDPTQSA